MSGGDTSTLASLWGTYWLRFAAAYVLLGLLCRLVRDPQLRSRIYGIFLGVMVAAWLGLFLVPSMPVPAFPAGRTIAGLVDPHSLWRLSFVLTPGLASLVSQARLGYLAILSVLVALFWVRFWRLRTLLCTSRPAPQPLSSLLGTIGSVMQAPQCELRLVPIMRSPAVAGWRRPKILLPDGLLTQLDVTQLTYIFRHELMHVRRRDYLWDKLTALACYLLFFHPAAWLIRRRLRRERELVCDGAVAQGSQRLDYAVCLTAVARWQLSAEKLAEAVKLLSSPSLLRARVHALASPPTEKYSRSSAAAVGALAVAVLVMGIWLVPGIRVIPVQSAIAAAPQHADRADEPTFLLQPTTTQKAERQAPRRPKAPESDMVAEDVYLRFEAPEAVPLSSTPAVVSSIDTPAVVGLRDAQTHPPSTPGPRWKLLPKAGAWAVRSAKLAASKVGSEIVDHVPWKPSGS